MMNIILISIGGLSVVLWGVIHLFPTKSVVAGFGDISTDNKRIVFMEWINEGVTLIFIGVLVLIITCLGDVNHYISKLGYASSSGMLFVMSVISLLTGFKINHWAFRLCPVIFSVSGLLILVGSLL
jgi:hypothetical protein